MHRRPAIAAVADERRDSLLARDFDQRRDETKLVAVMHLRKTNHRDAHSTVRQRCRGLIRTYSWKFGGGRIVFSRRTTGRNRSDAGGDDQGAVGANQRGAHRLDSAPIDLAVFLIFREIMDKRE